MSTGPLIDSSLVTVASGMEPASWFAIQTRSRHEKLVVRQLEHGGIESFLPVSTELRNWSDRRKLVQMPLFPGYAFVHIPYSPQERLRVLQTEGVVGFVGKHGQGIAIPASQIEDIRQVLASEVPFRSHPFLKVGQRVRVRGGSLDGVEGILVAENGDQSIVISVDPIQRALSIRIQGYQLEAA
jgi:transcription termination/antitermination protein NusG